MATTERELTVAEAERWAGVSRDTINGWIKQGRLHMTLVSGRRHVRLADLAACRATMQLGIVLPVWRVDPVRAGKRLRTLREAHGWSQQQLALRTGLTHEAISKIELGRRAPLAGTVDALAQALDVPVERFVDQVSLGLSYLTVGEAAACLGIPIGRLRKWLRQGLVDGTKIAGQWRVLSVAVSELEHSSRLRGRSRRLDPRYRG